MISMTRGLAIDIDETLAWTVLQWVEQLMPRFGNPENLTAEGICTKYRLTQNVPYWQSPEALAWMQTQRVTPESHRHIPVIPGAQQYLTLIHQIIPVSCYLTARPDSMQSVTRAWLEEHAFPAAPIITRPDALDFADIHVWKSKQLANLWPTVRGIIEDNDAILQQLPPDYPGTVILYSHERPPTTTIRTLTGLTWPDVYQTIKLNLHRL